MPLHLSPPNKPMSTHTRLLATLSLASLALTLSLAAACSPPGKPIDGGWTKKPADSHTSTTTVAHPRTHATASTLPPPPDAEKRPVTTTLHGESRTDNYAWLRHREDPAVAAYLEAENAYFTRAMAHTERLQQRLYDEMLSHIKETDMQPPFREGGFFRYTRTEEGKAYPIYCRKRGSLDAPEEIILDVNALAEGHEYTAAANVEMSNDGRILAWSEDHTGGEKYVTRFRDLVTKRHWPEEIPNTTYSCAWAADNRTFFYVTLDHAMRPDKVWRHTLGDPPSNDVMVFHEPDERFFVNVGPTRSRDYILIQSGSMSTTEILFLSAHAPQGRFQPIIPRQDKVEYDADHHGEWFYIVTNEGGATNFKLVRTPVAASGSSGVETLIPESESVYLTGVNCFADHLVLTQRRDGLQSLRVRRFSDNAEHEVSFPERAYAVFPMQNETFDTPLLRFNYMSFITPPSVFDYDMNTKQRTLIREQPVPNYDRSLYTVERLEAPARDGRRIPISMVYRKGLKRNGANPCVLYGYGSYGASMEPYFDADNLTLLDRGVIYAVAHIRGGSELGRRWYEDGRLAHKMNTFTDFIDCAEYLIDRKYTNPDRLAVMGGSAGGLLMGAVANMRPDLFEAVVAVVPFVDVVNTMLDPAIPLTVTEWEQWGDPRTPDDFRRIRAYSPYDNVAQRGYPHMLVMTSLNDPRVAYWEPAKWTAKLRDMKTDDNLLLLRTNMEAGHGGASGRYNRLREEAIRQAFILDRLAVE